MGLKSEDRQIGDYNYTVTQLGAVKGSEVMVRLANVLGKVVSKGSNLKEALASVASSLAPADLQFLCDAMATRTLVSGGEYKGPVELPRVFDMHFAGKYLEMLRWLSFALEVNFGGFFRGIGERAEAALAGLDSSKSDSPNMLTGSSGGS